MDQSDPTALPPAIRHLVERRRRLASGARDARDDGRRLGLVVQGGALRGVFTAGALCGLEELGYRDCFDRAYGASGGAINLAYFLAGQVHYGTSIYYSDINNRAFIDLWNPRRILGGTAVDIDYCFDEVIARRKRLALERILAHPTRFQIFLTDPERCGPHTVCQHELDGPAELLAALKASAAMQLVYRRPVRVGGRRYADGAFLTPVPLRHALADGCTDILVLLSKTFDAFQVPNPPGWMRPWMHRAMNRRRVAELEAAWQAGQAELRQALATLAAGPSVRQGDRTVHLACVTPPARFRVHRWTRDRAALTAAAREGAAHTHALFGVARPALETPETHETPETVRPRS